MNLRLFLSIMPDNKWRQTLTALIKKLHTESWGSRVHWTAPENLHLTLRFIGECSSEILPLLQQELASTIKKIAPFKLQAKSVQLFSISSHPRFIALGIILSSELLGLQQTIDQA